MKTQIKQEREAVHALTPRLCQRRILRVAQKGSHIQFKHPHKEGRVTVPHPKRDIPIGTLKNIEKQSGVRLR